MTEEQLALERLKRAPRTLDGPPKILSLTRLPTVDQCGYSKLFESMYNSLVSTIDEPLCSIDIMGNKIITCGTDVFCILKALLMCNVCYSIDFSTACSDLFKEIVMCGESHITAKTVVHIVSETKQVQYEAAELYKTVYVLLATNPGANETLALLKDITSETNRYPKLFELGKKMLEESNLSLAEFNKLIKSNATKAKKNGFMCQVDKVSRPYLGVLFWVYSSYPEVVPDEY